MPNGQTHEKRRKAIMAYGYKKPKAKSKGRKRNNAKR